MNIDLNGLLTPLSAQQPCGEDLTFSNAFHDIKKAQTHDDPLLDQGDWVLPPKQADWAFVAQHSVALLTQHSKDIRLITWLTEAWTHLYGFNGMASGIHISHQLLAEYWHQLHPQIEDNDLDQRLGLLQGMINQLPHLIKQVPLSHQHPHSTLLEYENLRHQLNQSRKHVDETDSAALALAVEQAEQRIVQISLPQRQQQYQQFLDILSHWQTLKQILEHCMQQDAPRFAQIDAMLEQIDTHLKKLYQVELWESPVPLAVTQADPDTALQQRLSAAFNQRHSSTQATLSTATANSESNSDHPPHPSSGLNGFEQLTMRDHAADQFGTRLEASSQAASQTTAQGTALNPQQLMLNTPDHLHNREQAIAALTQISQYFQKNEPHSPVSYLLQKTIHWSQLSLHEWLAQVIKGEQALADLHELLGVRTAPSQENS